jgi:hypothetical protein
LTNFVLCQKTSVLIQAPPISHAVLLFADESN